MDHTFDSQAAANHAISSQAVVQRQPHSDTTAPGPVSKHDLIQLPVSGLGASQYGNSTRACASMLGGLLGLLDLLCMLPLDVVRRAFLVSSGVVWPRICGLRATSRQARELCNSMVTSLSHCITEGAYVAAEVACKAKFFSSLQNLTSLSLDASVLDAPPGQPDVLSGSCLVPFFTSWQPTGACLKTLRLECFTHLSYGVFSLVAAVMPQIEKLELYSCMVEAEHAFMPLLLCKQLAVIELVMCEDSSIPQSEFDSLALISSLRALSIQTEEGLMLGADDSGFDCSALTGLTQLSSLEISVLGELLSAGKLAALTGLKVVKLPGRTLAAGSLADIVSGMAGLESLRVFGLNLPLINSLAMNCRKLQNIEAMSLSLAESTMPVVLSGDVHVLTCLRTVCIGGSVPLSKCAALLAVLPPTTQLEIECVVVHVDAEMGTIEQFSALLARVLNSCAKTLDAIVFVFLSQGSHSTEAWLQCVPETRFVQFVKLRLANDLSASALSLLCKRFPALRHLSLESCSCQEPWAAALAALFAAQHLSYLKVESCSELDSATLTVFAYLHPVPNLMITGTYNHVSCLLPDHKRQLKEAFCRQ